MLMSIDGIHVDSIETEEQCGNCRNYLELQIYLSMARKKRIFAISCPTCKTDPVIIQTVGMDKTYSQLQAILPKRRKKPKFITDKW